MPLNNTVFTDVEEIGFRCKAIRLSRQLSVSSVRADHMTDSAYVRSESGKGSLNTLIKINELLNINTILMIKDKNTDHVNEIKLSDIHDFLKDYRQKNNYSVSRLANIAKVPYASIEVFENTNRPQVNSISKYLHAMNIDYSIAMYDATNGKILDLSKIVHPLQLEKVQEEFNKKTKMNNLDNDFIVSVGESIKNFREKKNITKSSNAKIAGLTDTSVAKVESGKSMFSTIQKVLNAMNAEMFITINGKDIPLLDVTKYLDNIRETRSISASDMSRKIGTTYRAVKIFTESQPTPGTVYRYAHALDLDIKCKIKEKTKTA